MKSFTGYKFSLALISLVLVWGVCAEVPSGYYNSLEGLSGTALKKAVKKIATKNFKSISYGNDTWSVFYESDTHIVNGQLCWWDLYSPNNVPATGPSAPSSMNIEHGVPNSWWGKTKNNAYKDLFHLGPSDSKANSSKGNYPLGIVSTATFDNGVTKVGKPSNSNSYGGATYVYEPADYYKGDFARTYFYMFTIYDDIAWTDSWDWMYDTSSDMLLRPWAYDMLLSWAKNDPVSQKEIDRNEVISKHQLNRNPFIDCPGLADHIWGSKKNTPFHYDGSYEPDPDPDDPVDPDTPDDPVGPDEPVPSDGYWYAVTSSADLNENDTYILVATDSHVAMSYDATSTSSAAYLHECSSLPVFDDSRTPAFITALPSDVAVLNLSKADSGWTIRVSKLSGENVGYLCSSSTKKVNYTSNPNDAAAVVSIIPSAAQTQITFSTASGDFQHNNNENGHRFTTYTSQQESVMLYRTVRDNGESRIDRVETAENQSLEIYRIDGVRINAPLSSLSPGLYIVRTPAETRKIIIR